MTIHNNDELEQMFALSPEDEYALKVISSMECDFFPKVERSSLARQVAMHDIREFSKVERSETLRPLQEARKAFKNAKKDLKKARKTYRSVEDSYCKKRDLEYMIVNIPKQIASLEQQIASLESQLAKAREELPLLTKIATEENRKLAYRAMCNAERAYQDAEQNLEYVKSIML